MCVCVCVYLYILSLIRKTSLAKQVKQIYLCVQTFIKVPF